MKRIAYGDFAGETRDALIKRVATPKANRRHVRRSFDTLRVKVSLIVACNRRLAFAGETRFMLNKHEANRLWRFCLRRLRTFFAKKVLRTPKNAQGII